MTALVYVVIALGLIALALFVLRKPIRSYVSMRGDRVVACPETNETVAVRVDAAHAAIARTGGLEHLRLESCTRWPEKAACGQECLSQIEAAPDDCLVRTHVTRWYANKACVLCGKALGRIDWTQHKPAIMTHDGRTMEWRDVRPENLPSVLATHSAICWDCHIAQTFRRVRPDLVIDNPFHTNPGRPH